VHETVIPDFHKPGGQHVLEKPSDEFECRKTHGFVRTAFRIGVSEKHPVVSQGDDTMIGDGGTEYV
jgi:hypothetical protein